jgi:hypothetical protein
VPSAEPSYKTCASVTLACKAVLSAGGGGGVESFLLHEARINVSDKLNSNTLLKNLKPNVVVVMIV